MQTILNEKFYPLKDFRVNEEKMISNGLETEIIKKPNKYFWKKEVFYDSKPFWKVKYGKIQQDNLNLKTHFVKDDKLFTKGNIVLNFEKGEQIIEYFDNTEDLLSRVSYFKHKIENPLVLNGDFNNSSNFNAGWR